jgi:hypothetical protein
MRLRQRDCGGLLVVEALEQGGCVGGGMHRKILGLESATGPKILVLGFFMSAICG